MAPESGSNTCLGCNVEAPRTSETWLRQLLAVQAAITAAGGDLGLVMQAVVAGALQLIPQADSAMVLLREGDDLVYRAASGAAAHMIGYRVPVANSLAGRCLVDGKPQLSANAAVDPRMHRSAARRIGMGSAMLVPLARSATNVGVLSITARMPDRFDGNDLLTTQLLASPIAAGFANVAHAASEEARQAADRRFIATFEQAAVGIAHVAPDGRFLLVNDRFCAIAARPREQLLAGGFQAITHPDDLDADLAYVHALLAGEIDHYRMEKRYLRSDGSWVWVALTVSLVRDDGGEPDFFVAVIEDVSARHAAEEAAARDPLTGLLNRRGFVDALARELERTRIIGQGLAVAYLDLDGFKAVNDLYGHAEGDRCLAKIADGLRGALPPVATIARIGGDEFVVTLPVSDRTDAVLESLRDIVVATADGEPWHLTAAVGAVLVPPAARIEAGAVIARADALMYRAKHACSSRPFVEPLAA